MSFRYWSSKYNNYRVDVIKWFIKKVNWLHRLIFPNTNARLHKNDTVEEMRLSVIIFTEYFHVSEGEPKSTSMQDALSLTAPLYKNENVQVLVSLKAALSHLTKSELAEKVTQLGDG